MRAGADDPVADVVGGRRARRRGGRPGLDRVAGERHCALCDAELGLTRTPRQALDVVAVVVARALVHQGVHAGRVLAERLLDGRERLHERRPVDLDAGAQGEHRVGDGHLPLRLALGLEPLDVVERDAPRSEPLLEPFQRGGVAAACLQVGRQGVHEGVGERRALAGHLGQVANHLRRIGAPSLGDPTGPLGRGVAVGEGLAHGTGEGGHALGEDDALQDGQRPQLGQREELDLLVALHEGLEVVGVGGVVREVGEGLREFVDPRQPAVRSAPKLGEDPVVRPRERRLGLAELVADDVEVVQQPLGRRRQLLAGPAGRGQRPVGFGKAARGIAKERPQGLPARDLGLDGLRPREPPRVLGEMNGLEQALGVRGEHGSAD